MNWRERLEIDPEICHGKVRVKGTRIMVTIILDNLSSGESREEILDSYPTLQAEDIDAAMSYAAELARENAYRFPALHEEIPI